MVEKVSGYIYNHTKGKFLEIFIYNNLSHTKLKLEKIASKNNLKITKNETTDINYGLTRYYIYYEDYDLIKSYYKEINEKLNIKPITYYETIRVVRALLKNAFR